MLILDSDTVADNLSLPLALPCTGLLRLSGVDAEAFAQSQFANDVLALAPGQWQWNCWLSAKGRVLAVFALLRQAPGELLLVLPDGGALALGQSLARFVFRRKLTLAVDDAPVGGLMAAPVRACGATAAIGEDGVIELDWGSTATPRTLRIGAPVGDGDQMLWRQADLIAGLPRLDASQHDSWTAQQLGLDRLAAYSVRKGCYPGQEIVARTHFLGKAKRATTLLSGIGHDALPGQDVACDGHRIGQLACVAAPYALAVMPLETPAGPLQVNGVEVQAIALEDGLQR